MLFFAEKWHLNEYGRPILGDTYDALPHGPVARTVYGLLKQDDALIAQFLAERCGLDEGLPFSVYNRYWVKASRPARLAAFSESEIDALQWSYDKYSSMSFRQLHELTHAEPAWRNARERGGIMRYEDMLDAGNNSGR